jgi:hypothetical protein
LTVQCRSFVFRNCGCISVPLLLAGTMDPDPIAKTFYFCGQSVGYFEDAELPSKPGHYRYMPYRGVGHYRLMEALRKGEPQQCHYVVSGAKRQFTVMRWIEYGHLELAKFDPLPAKQP